MPCTSFFGPARMTDYSLLFLDFDGVICDSVNETYASSWLAYFKYLRHRLPAAVSLAQQRRYMRLRPFIRSGEDYLLIQDIIADDLDVQNQEMFDALAARAGSEKMGHYRTVFYQARTEIIESFRNWWLTLNPLYPHMGEVLRLGLQHKSIYILSAKKTEFIHEILAFHGLDYDSDRIIHSGPEEKTAIISRLLDRTEARSACFIDDQISHLLGNRDPRITPRLASWGYIDGTWLTQHDVQSITPEELQGLVRQIVGNKS